MNRFKKATRFLWVIISISFVACTSRQEESGLKTIKINPDELINVPGDGAEWIESIKFLPLKSDGEHFVNMHSGTKFRDKLIIIGSMEDITIFDNRGNFINQIRKKGNGPEEYSFIADYDLIPGSDQLVILANKKLLFYTIHGEFIEAVNIPVGGLIGMAALSEDRFAFNLGRERSSWNFEQDIKHQLVIINREGKIIDQRFEFPYSSKNYPGIDIIHPSADGNSYLFHFYFDYNVYSINTDGDIRIKYAFDYGDLASDTAFLQQASLETLPNIFPKITGRFCVSSNFSETTNSLCLSLGSDKLQKMTCRIINRKSGNQISLVMDDNHHVSRFHGWPIYSPYDGAAGDYFFYPLQAIDAVEFRDQLTKEQRKKLSTYSGFDNLDRIDEEDEMLFVLFKVKGF